MTLLYWGVILDLQNMKFNKILVFGVFDGFHKGHEFFLKEARKFGDFLVVAVTPDETVKSLKGATPKNNLVSRIQSIANSGLVDECLIGDPKLGSWKIFDKIKPDLIVLGYDQENLRAAIQEFFGNSGLNPNIKIIGSFQPHLYKSSFLNKKAPDKQRA